MNRIALIALLVACKRDQPAKEAPKAAPVLSSNVPSSTACKVDDDCIVVPVAPSNNPCCDYTVTALPIASAYIRFVEDWRKTHCTGVECPSNDLPGALLADCGYEPKCVAEKCTNSCN